MSSNSSPRLSAVKILQNVIVEQQSLSQQSFPHPLSQEICYGTLRWYFRLKPLLNLLLIFPHKKLDSEIEIVLLTGLYQLLYLHEPDYAIVNETVSLVKQLHKSWAVKFTNAILRKFLRDKVSLLTTIDKDKASQTAHPAWLYKKLLLTWPEYLNDILSANNQHPPFTLRINQLTAQREDFLPGEIFPHNNCGIIIIPTKDILQSPEFKQGKFSVQDGAAQLAAELLLLQPQQIVLDACAAPGGKTAHILELQPQLQNLIALDISQPRLLRIKETLNRLHLNAELIVGDATKPEQWQQGQRFDRILIDAPCSATGVIRRHPDIKYHRQLSDIAKLIQTQRLLLKKIMAIT